MCYFVYFLCVNKDYLFTEIDQCQSKAEHVCASVFENARFINSKNRASLSYRLAVNHLADLSHVEMKMLCGRRYSPGYNGGLPFNKSAYNVLDLPDQIDWRLYGMLD